MAARLPDDERFDWSAEEHATIHGFSVFDIEDAFDDAGGIYLETSRTNRRGESYADDDRITLLAQVKPNGPLLHIVFVTTADARIRPFHCREMNATEKRRYQRG